MTSRLFVYRTARVAKLVDAPGLGLGDESRAGSSPAPRTKYTYKSTTYVVFNVEIPIDFTALRFGWRTRF